MTRRIPKTIGNAALRIDGERATLTLPDWSIESYRTWIDIKASLPRVRVTAATRTIECATADLVRFGIRVRDVLGAFDPAGTALFPDQAYVVDVALRRKRFAMLCEAGWGKSIAQLAWAREVARRTQRKVLIVAPLAVVRQTQDEHAKFFPGDPPIANLRLFVGGIAGWLAAADTPSIAIVNVDLFRKPVDLAGLGGIVLDESSVLKQASGVLRNSLVRAVEPVEYRLACSATPAPNDLDEYVSHALFLGAIRTHKEFFADYFASDGEGGWNLRPYATKAFYAFMASWSIWIRDPATYGFAPRLGGVPAPVFHDIAVEATDEQRREALHYRKQGHLFLDEVGVVKRSKLAQISRGFIYEGGKARQVQSLKPTAVADAVCAHPGERAVVWVTFNEESRLIADALIARGRRVVAIDGETSDDARAAAVADLNAGAIDVLIGKPAQMGFGLNLQGASVCVFSGINDSFEQDYQAFRRLFRYGQERTVHCYYVTTEYEAPMLANVRRKRAQWAEQAIALERAYLEASGADLAAYRGARKPIAERTRYELSDADREALAAVCAWSEAS
jgi:hypothetical protein